MLPTIKRFFLLTLLALTGLAAVLVTLAVYHAGRTPEAFAWAAKGALAHGYLLLLSFGAFTALDRPICRTLALAGMSLAGLMLLTLPIFIYWEITGPLALAPFNALAHE